MSGNRQRARAQNALQRVQEIAEQQDDKLKKSYYRRYVEALGAAIVMNGLGQALATECAAARGDKESAHGKLFGNLGAWLTHTVYAGRADVLEAVIREGQEHYLRAQAEALAWLSWHKKFCQAYLPKDTPQDAEDSQ